MNDLTGTWKVKVTTGPKWFRMFNLLRDKKIISGNTGNNIIYGIPWGEFTVEHFGSQRFVLAYKNQPIVDNVWACSKGLLFGTFYWAGKHVGTFEMRRI